MESHVRTAFELEYITKEDHDRFLSEYQTIGKQLTNLIKFWRVKAG